MIVPIARGATSSLLACLAAALFWQLSFAPTKLYAEPRTWTASNGRSIEAELTGYDPNSDMVGFRRADGLEFKFPLRSLSVSDLVRVKQIYLAEGKRTSQRIDQLIQRRMEQPHTNQPYFTNLQAMVDRASESDEEFLKRVSTAIIGRDPTEQELAALSQDDASDKRHAAIDALLASEDFGKHFTDSFLAELLQVDGTRPATVAYAECTGPLGTGKEQMRESIAGRRPIPQPALYREWVEQQVRDDRPWDEWVTELLTASGLYTNNPATGYLIVNSREPYLTVNPAPVMTAFAGTEITCAQCHHHPEEEIYQLDFFKLAAYFSALEVKMRNSETTPSGFDFELSDSLPAGLSLPLDYAYDDAGPGDYVSPQVYFGKQAKADDPANQRRVFADWLTDESNQRFTINIANRIAAYVFGNAPIQPIDNLPGHLREGSYDMTLLDFLVDVTKQKDYQLREVLRVLYHTETFSGLAAQQQPPDAQVR